MERRPNCFCFVCNQAMYRRPAQILAGKVYCSSACCGKQQQVTKTCKICQKTFTGGKQTCSRACANRARAGIVYTRTNTYNQAYQGRLLKKKSAKRCNGVCERCGERNYAILQIHHKIERHNGGSNSLTNLELLCPNCHVSHHQGNSLYKPEKML